MDNAGRRGVPVGRRVFIEPCISDKKRERVSTIEDLIIFWREIHLL